jgi:uncharacterized protein (TIGR03067 family)
MLKFFSLILVVAVAPLAQADEVADKELKALQGEWTWAHHEVGGTMMLPDPNDRPVIRIEKEKWSFKNKSLEAFKEVGTFKLDVATTPKCVDLISTDEKSKGQKNEAIYKLEEDKLTVVVNLNADDKNRPMGFETKDKPGMILVVFERKR